MQKSKKSGYSNTIRRVNLYQQPNEITKFLLYFIAHRMFYTEFIKILILNCVFKKKIVAIGKLYVFKYKIDRS